MKKILIVDDAIESRIIMKKLLSKFNFEILEAKDGLEGWNMMIKEKPDLVLLELHMPKKDGFETLNDIQEEWLDIPTIILSGDDSHKTIHSCLSNGAAAFIPKPIDKNLFYQKISDRMAEVIINYK
ncbi:response regulator [Plebeiibacterium sediminum]|uniref:Response regulator n=1 Tax=Plebeiibacterium sediminum TaxID=2992112 RepID=A0AAE3M1A6_9BACT|nr:response regulator [Plebeiobacterium sediminum]MCW3785284.1 response regulator [Plebeiobacterium sediminum]